MLTIVLSIGIGAVIAMAYRADIAANWKERRCDPGVMALAAGFKPANDPRTATQFAEDNWKECQKEYVQSALREAVRAPQMLATEAEGVVGIVEKIGDKLGDVFYDLWKMMYSAYSKFMDTMTGTSKLFMNFMVQMSNIVQQLQAAVLSIFFGLYSMMVAFVNSVQLILIVAIVIIGIMIALEIILFFIFPPIFGVVATLVALVSVVAVAVATAIGAAMVAEMFVPGACFESGTLVIAQDGTHIPIKEVQIGMSLRDGGRVVAVHEFRSSEGAWDLYGVRVTGDHLVTHPASSSQPNRMIPVRDHPDARAVTPAKGLFGSARPLWCLTTTTRRIPVHSPRMGAVIFADWEEIPEGDAARQRLWFEDVWIELNGNKRGVPSAVPAGEAGLSPDCRVATVDWLGRTVWKPVRDVGIGDTVLAAVGVRTRVVGRVVLEGDQSTDAVTLGGTQVVAAATWLQRRDGVWAPAVTALPRIEIHPMRWIHLYTEAGTFMIEGGWCVRDFSDVGLDGLRPMVENIVLG